ARAIDRVEVAQDGASSIYGAGAIAGVVNIITKRHQQGFEASAQLGKYLDEGDGFTQNYQLSWGNGDSGPLQVVIGGNFVKANGVLAGDRAISRFANPYATSCAEGGCSAFAETDRFVVLQDPSLPFDPGCTDPDTCSPVIDPTNIFQNLTLHVPETHGR